VDPLAQAVISGADAQELARMPLPPHYQAAHLRVEDVDMFRDAADKDVRKSLHVGQVPMPHLAPDEVLVAVMASSVNYNTVWSAMFEPVPTFEFLRRYGRQGGFAARHNRAYHVVGSDGAGVVVRVGAGVRHWRTGDRVVISPAHIDDQQAASHEDGMMGTEQRAWGFETNFGALAQYTVARAGQLLPKPEHLSWEEAASMPLCGGTAYRMLIGRHGAQIKQGDIVLIWGALGGLGAYAVQLVKGSGGIPVGVVGSPEKARLARTLGCAAVIDRHELGLDERAAADPENTPELGRRLGRAIRAAVGEDPHVVFDYTGRSTFGLSVYVVRRGGVVVTCGSSSGYQHQYDNRYLWMNLKRVIGSHIANLQEMHEFNRLVRLGRIQPALSTLYPLAETAEAVRLVQTNQHHGKVGVLALAPEPGLGISDPSLRADIGEGRITPLQNTSSTDSTEVRRT
jgi:crotonyl-CoA reductase